LEPNSLVSGPLFSRSDMLATPSPVPASPGLYAWLFRKVPDGVPTDGCLVVDGRTLLYIGISPDRAGKPDSSQTLRSRIRHHYTSNAEGSTLRRTLGVLLEHKSGFPLRRVGSGKRITLTHAGEQWLDRWMDENAFVTWIEHPEPWTVERRLLGELSCPLNVAGNGDHLFSARLQNIRSAALRRAREMPIADEHSRVRSAMP
jgi:hypothetical protein